MEDLIRLSHLPTHSQLADVLTKVLPAHQHWTLLHKLSMLPNPTKLEGGGVLGYIAAYTTSQELVMQSWKVVRVFQ